MKIDEKIKGIFDALKIQRIDKAIHVDLSYCAFLISLLPIPGIQQSAQIIDRITSNKNLNDRFNNVWEEIKIVNSKLDQIADEFEKFQEIAGAVKYNLNLNNNFEKLITETINLLDEPDSEFTVLTEHWSYQEILNSIIDVDYAQIIALSGSTNVIENTEFNAKKTLLRSSNNSKNYVDNTSFKGKKGSVRMNGITTQGNIVIKGSGIGMRGGSTIIFGGNPNILTGECSICTQTIQVDKRQLVGFSRIQCPHCKALLNFKQL